MTSPPLRITTAETLAPSDDRFDRFRQIAWWDQGRLSRAKVLVVGAGALGNEIIKNLALLGIGNVLIADFDRVEHSNLSRSVLFREADNGASKAEVAARSAACSTFKGTCGNGCRTGTILSTRSLRRLIRTDRWPARIA